MSWRACSQSPIPSGEKREKQPVSRAGALCNSNIASFHDITSGRNGSFGARRKAKAGYDFVTGIGSPGSELVIAALIAAE